MLGGFESQLGPSPRWTASEAGRRAHTTRTYHAHCHTRRTPARAVIYVLLICLAILPSFAFSSQLSQTTTDELVVSAARLPFLATPRRGTLGEFGQPPTSISFPALFLQPPSTFPPAYSTTCATARPFPYDWGPFFVTLRQTCDKDLSPHFSEHLALRKKPRIAQFCYIYCYVLQHRPVAAGLPTSPAELLPTLIMRDRPHTMPARLSPAASLLLYSPYFSSSLSPIITNLGPTFFNLSHASTTLHCPSSSRFLPCLHSLGQRFASCASPPPFVLLLCGPHIPHFVIPFTPSRHPAYSTPFDAPIHVCFNTPPPALPPLPSTPCPYPSKPLPSSSHLSLCTILQAFGLFSVSLACEREALVLRMTLLYTRLRLHSIPRTSRSHFLRRWFVALGPLPFPPSPPSTLFPLVFLSWHAALTPFIYFAPHHFVSLAQASHPFLVPLLALIIQMVPLYLTLVAFANSLLSPLTLLPARSSYTHPWRLTARSFDRTAGLLISLLSFTLRVMHALVSLLLAFCGTLMQFYYGLYNLPQPSNLFGFVVSRLHRRLDSITHSHEFSSIFLPTRAPPTTPPPAPSLPTPPLPMHNTRGFTFPQGLFPFTSWIHDIADCFSLFTSSRFLPLYIFLPSYFILFDCLRLDHVLRALLLHPCLDFPLFDVLMVFIGPSSRLLAGLISRASLLRQLNLWLDHAPCAVLHSRRLDSPLLDVILVFIQPTVRFLSAEICRGAILRPLTLTLFFASRSRSARRLSHLYRFPTTSLRAHPSLPLAGWSPDRHLHAWSRTLLARTTASTTPLQRPHRRRRSSLNVFLTAYLSSWVSSECLPPGRSLHIPRRHTPAAVLLALLLLSINPASLLNPGPPPPPPAKRSRSYRDHPPPSPADPRRLLPPEAHESWTPQHFAEYFEPGDPLRLDVRYPLDDYPNVTLMPPPAPPSSHPCSEPSPPVSAAPPPSPPMPDSLLMCTWNVRSLTTKLSTIHSLLTTPFYTTHGPRPIDILILTETKLCPADHRHGSLRNILALGPGPSPTDTPPFSTHFSSSPPTCRNRRQWTRAGVCILLRPEWRSCVRPRAIDSERLQGYTCSIDLHHGESGPCFLRVIGVYLPCDNHHLRSEIYAFLRTESQAATAAGVPILIGGDMNAVLHPCHRSGRTNMLDQGHGRDVSAAGLVSAFGTGPRPPTWSNTLQTQFGSLDDFLCSTLSLPHLDSLQPPPVAHAFDHTSDHNPLLLALSLPSLGAGRPPPPTPPLPVPSHRNTPNLHSTSTIVAGSTTDTPRFGRFAPVELLAFRTLCDDRLHASIAEAHAFVRASLASLDAGAPGHSIDGPALSTLLDAVHAQALAIAVEVCPRPTPAPPVTALPRRAGAWLPRAVAHSHGRAVQRASACRRAVRSLRNYPPQLGSPPWRLRPVVVALTTLCPHLTPSPEVLPCVWALKVAEAQRTYVSEASSLVRSFQATGRKAHATTLNALYRRDRKKGHQAVLQPDRSVAPSLACIRNTAGVVLTEPSMVRREAAAQYATTLSPAQQTTASDSAPLTLHPPWAPAACLDLDPMALRSSHTTSSVLRPTAASPPLPLLTLLTRARYDGVLRARKNRKASGPSGFRNELLKALPPRYHDMFYDLCILQLRSSRTFLSKHSHTILLHKAGDPTVLSNFRPIGLCECTLKLWTALLTDLLGDYASIAGIISDSQSGFRRHRRCLHQLLKLTNTIEDSNLHKHPLFVLYLDFKGAFPSVDHSRLTDCMSLLGLPKDAIDTVRDLYTDNTTSLLLPGGVTAPVTIKRGTIQGDSLSPLLFLFYIEPLLQWLDQGSDGYPMQSAIRHTHRADAPVERSNVSAFADDLALFSSSLRGIRRALQKVELFCAWARMDLNASKCRLTGTEHHRRTTAQVCAAASTITIGGTPLPFISPTTPYKYLGVLTCLTLASCHQEKMLCDLVRSRCESIQHSALYDSVMSEVVESLVVSMISYSLPTCVLSATALAAIQALLNVTNRIPYRLSPSSSSLLLRLPQSTIVGLGLPDLVALSASGALESCFVGLNDKGTLGRQCRALATSIMERHGYDLDVLRVSKRTMSPWTRRLLQVARLSPAKLHEDGADWLLATSSHPPPRRILSWFRSTEPSSVFPTPALPSPPPVWLPPLWELGIITIDSVLTENRLLTVPEFRVRYPCATADQSKAFASLRGHSASHTPSFAAFLGTFTPAATPAAPNSTVSPVVDAAAHDADTTTTNPPPAAPPTIPPLTRASRPNTTAPTPLRLWTLPGSSSLPAMIEHMPEGVGARYYSNRELFPCLDAVLARRCCPTSGFIQYLLQWSPGRLPRAQYNASPTLQRLAADTVDYPQPRGTSSSKRAALARDLLVTWHPHWCAASPAVMTTLRLFPALSAFETLRALPPAPLGHPLPTAYLDTSALSIKLDDIRPEYDIAPMPAPAVFVSDGTAYVYSLEGRLCGCFPEERLQHLWHRFSAHSTRPDLATLRPECFEAELVHLLRRYRSKSSHDAGGKVNLKNHWAVPKDVMRALRAVTSFSTEMFASPLNVSPSSPTYFSVFSRDQLFGAQLDAYSQHWRGSVEINPEYEAPDMAKALRWALASASSAGDTAFLTLAILPAWETHPHAAVLRSHASIHILATIPAGTFCFRRATYTPYDTTQATHAKWPIHLAIIANPAGYDQYFKSAALEGLAIALRSHAASLRPRATTAAAAPAAVAPPVIPHLPPRPLNRTVPLRAKQLPKGFLAAASSPPSHLQTVPLHTTVTQDTRSYVALPLPPRLFDPASIFYTDASQADPATGTGPVGVGIHCPKLGVSRHFVASDQPRTVQRGELAGIWWAVLNAPPNDPLHIASDSLTSLQQLHSTLYRTDSTADHQHYEMLAGIVHHALFVRTAPCVIQKIRAHAGIPGNEEADRLAKLGTTNILADPLTPPRTNPGPFAPWPPAVLGLPHGPILAVNTRRVVLAIHEHQAVAAIDQLSVTATSAPAAADGPRLPHSNARFWCQAREHLLPKESTAFLRSRGLVPRRTLQLAVQFRHWTYCGQARLHQMGLAPSPLCLLCGSHMDTPVYAGGGCSHQVLSDMATTSHNQAVHLILDAIREGTHGGDRLLANAGSQHIGTRHERTVPSFLVPDYPGYPDAMACLGLPTDAPDPHAPTPSIVYAPLEITRTYDTNIPRSTRRKQSKYTHDPVADAEFVTDTSPPPFPHLLRAMRARGHRVLGWDPVTKSVSETGDRILVIALGTTGSLPQSLVPIMTALGLSVAQRSTLFLALHKHALRRLRAMVDTRSHLQRSGIG